jgi:hypothetical protein
VILFAAFAAVLNGLLSFSVRPASVVENLG